MTPRERFLGTLNFDKTVDRLPMVEWAAWWNLTTDRWKQEGLPADIGWYESLEYFGLDTLVCIGMGGGASGDCPESISRVVTDEKAYDALEGVYPLEKQAGVDIVRIRREHLGKAAFRVNERLS